jgi:phosphoglycerate dehydrogenase-like enzyme
MPIKMVFWSKMPEEWMEKVRDLKLEVCEVENEGEALTEISDADAYYGRMSPELLAAAKQLRWVQATSAGLDNYFFPELRAHEAQVTNMRGIYSDVIAEHVFAFLLSLSRGMQIYIRRQAEGKWEKQGVDFVHVAGKTLGVLGLGGIGLAVASRGSAFGMRVLAVDPAPKGKPAHVERIYEPDELKEMLAEVDFLTICVPHTGQTEHMIDADAIKAMKKSAILINIGRGKVLDLNALTVALEAGELAGAALDVFEEEPLREGHPLWAMENVIVTPHVAAHSDEIEPRRYTLIVENVRRFCAGERLLNVVDKQAGYVVEKNDDDTFEHTLR